MAKEAKKLVGVFLDQKVIDRVDGWAEKFGISRSKMAGIMVEGTLERDWLLLDIVSSPIGLKAAEFFKIRPAPGAPPAQPEAAST